MRPTPRLLGAGAIALAVAVTAACTSPPSEEDIDRQISIAVSGVAVGSWDPAEGGGYMSGNYPVQAVMSSLFYWEPSGEAWPMLGETYEVADDRLSVDVTLRDGIEFADGSAVDADAIVAFYDHILAEESTWAYKANAVAVGAEFSAVDDRTVRLSFDRPVFHPAYLEWDIIRLLFVAPVISPSGLADLEAAAAAPMGVGPYLVEEHTDAEMTLVRNPDYWDPQAYPFDTVVLKLLVDPIAKLNALKSGQVDVAQLSVEHAAEAEASGFTVRTASPHYITLIVRHPVASTLEPIRDVRVRRAMMLAFDREAIADTIDLGFGRASSQAFVEGQPEYVEGGDERYGYDPERACELMAEAGYADGFDLTIPIWGDTASVEPVIRQSLADIGIRVTFETRTDVLQALLGGEYPVVLYRNENVITTWLLDQEFSGLGRFFDRNAELDRLLELIRFGDAVESAEASRELGEKLLDEAWYIPVSRPPVVWASAPGYEVVPDDVHGGPIWLYQYRVGED